MLGAVPLTPTRSPQVRQWLDGEGAARLREMGAEECSSDSCERSTERWSEFLLQAAVRTATSGVTSQHSTLPSTGHKHQRAKLEQGSDALTDFGVLSPALPGWE